MDKGIYDINKYIRGTKICGVCGTQITSKGRVSRCSLDCESAAHEMFLSHDETGGRPIWMVLDIMRKNGISWREYARDRNAWHMQTYGGSYAAEQK